MLLCCAHHSITSGLSRERSLSNANEWHLVASFSVLRLPAWHFRQLDSNNWRVLLHGFGMQASLVNFKLTKKPSSGASSHSWPRSLLQAQRATRTYRGSSPPMRGEADSNPPLVRPAPLRLQTDRLWIARKFWPRPNRYQQLGAAPCRGTSQQA